MTDLVGLSNQSLLSIGARATISNLTEGSDESNACSTLIPLVYQDLGRRAWWNCLRRETTLTLLKAAPGTPENPMGSLVPYPATPWLYSYALPSDSLKIRCVIPNIYANLVPSSGGISTGIINAPLWLPTDGEIPFAVAYDVDASNNPIQVILTNLSQANCIYTVNQPNPVIWDVGFQTAFVAMLASYLVPALSLNIELAQMKMKEAMAIVVEARVEDGNEGYSSQDHIPDWLIARGYFAGRYPRRNGCGFGDGGWYQYQDGGSGSW